MAGRRHGGGGARGAASCWRSTSAGLDRLDREILEAICVKFAGGPVGLSTLAVAVGEEQDTIEDVYEPYLLQEGLIKRTPRGRAATPAAFAHLGLEPPAPARRRRCSEAGPARGRPAQPRPRFACVVCVGDTMAHPFICPNCGHRTSELDRNIGFTRQPKGCAKCGFAFLFELLDDYYPAPDAAFFVCDGEGRVIGCGKNSFAFTGLEEEEVIGQRVEQVLGLSFANGDDPVATVLEWGVRALEVPVQRQRRTRRRGERESGHVPGLRRRRWAVARAHPRQVV